MKGSMKVNRESQAHKLARSIEIQEDFSPTFNNLTVNQIGGPVDNNNHANDQLSQQSAKFTFKQIKIKAKSTIIDYLKNKIRVNSFTETTFNNLLQIQQAPSFSNFFQLFFNLIRDAISEHAPESCRESLISPRDMSFPLKSKQCRKIRLLKEQQLDKKKKKKSFKHLNIVEKTNQEVKKQLFAVRDENNRLQRLIACMAEEFRDRKNFYLAEIKKLTQILSVSAKDVKKFIMQQTKQGKILNEKQEKKGQNTSRTRVQFDPASTSQLQRNFTGNSFKTGNAFSYQKQNSNLLNPRASNFCYKNLKNIPSIQQLDEQKTDIYQY